MYCVALRDGQRQELAPPALNYFKATGGLWTLIAYEYALNSCQALKQL
jgi:hypothetical protein